ncbi:MULTISPECIES: Ig-specific serine endopeptidase MIP [unclassified Mycoplasma]|uniref:Ig-specific serine endopeptidase MIP n=1 Tax=Mycoplasma sp. 125 TaxID=3447505 RepID=UPI003F65A261
MNTKKKRTLLNILISSSVLSFLPTLGLISCENEQDKEKRLVKEALTKLEGLLKNVENENKTNFKSKAYIESKNEIKKINELLEDNNISNIELKKAKTKLSQLNNQISSELENIRKINEENDGKPKIDSTLKYSDEQFLADFNRLTSSQDIETNFVLSFENLFPYHEKKQIFPSQLQKQYASLVIKAKDDAINKKIEFSVFNIDLADKANTTGEAEIRLVFRNKATNTQKNYKFKLSGLNKNNFNVDSEGNRPNGRVSDEKIEESEIQKYQKLSQYDRYKKDNNEYVERLKDNYKKNGINNLKDFRAFLNISDAKKKEFDQKAQELKLDTYENSAYKGFSVPTYKQDGTLDGLELNGVEVGKQPSLIDSLGKPDIFKTIGVARTIINEQYLKIAKQTFSISISNYKTYEKEISESNDLIKFWKDEKNEETFKKKIQEKIAQLKEDKKQVEADWDKKIKENTDEHLVESLNKQKTQSLKEYDDRITHFEKHTRPAEIKELEQKINEYKKRAESKKENNVESGTMWILDFQPDNTGKYPTKWYFGTNAHVARAITKDLSGFSLTRINKDIHSGAKLRISDMDDNITTFGTQNKDAIRTIFNATDYLSTHPTDFLSERQKKIYEGVEEFADFAVIEIDFEKIKDFSASSNSTTLTEVLKAKKDFNLAKEVTNDYANDKKSHIKFRSKSYLVDYQAIDYPLSGKIPPSLDHLFAVGWPSAREDFYLKAYIDDDQRERAKFGYSFSLWFNANYDFYDAKLTNSENGPSSFPSDVLNRGNYLSYQIGYRSFADKPGVLDSFISAPINGDKLFEYENKKYISMSLNYLPRRWAPAGGSSGSSIRNQNNELVAIHHTTNQFARTGLALAFRSEGFNYQGLFGTYNLPEYDLIYGGGKDQTKSYRQALKNLYPNLQKTNLFANGLGDENIPEQFKFKKGTTR